MKNIVQRCTRVICRDGLNSSVESGCLLRIAIMRSQTDSGLPSRFWIGSTVVM